MSKFEELVAVKTTLSIYINRKSALAAVNNQIKDLEDLNKDNPSLRIFNRIEKEANELL